MTEAQQYEAIRAAMQKGLETGACKMSKSGSSVIFANRNGDPRHRSDLSGIVSHAMSQIEEADLMDAYNAAVIELTPTWKETESKEKARAAKKRERDARVIAEKPAKEAARKREEEAREREALLRREQATAERKRQDEERQRRRAELEKTRFRSPVRNAPAVGATFRAPWGDVLVCTGHSERSWYLSQSQIDDNDDFELDGVALTYVYFREASAEEIATFEATEEEHEKRAEAERTARELFEAGKRALFLEAQATAVSEEWPKSQEGDERILLEGNTEREYGAKILLVRASASKVWRVTNYYDGYDLGMERPPHVLEFPLTPERADFINRLRVKRQGR